MEFPVIEYLYKIGVVIVIVAFFVGFLGTSFENITFSFHYYQYIYMLVIMLAGASYGILGGFLTSTAFCTLHIIAIRLIPHYYKMQPQPVNFNIQFIVFTLAGVLSGLAFDSMARQLAIARKTAAEAMRKSGASELAIRDGNRKITGQLPTGAISGAGGSEGLETAADPTRFVNIYHKFAKNILGIESENEILEQYVKLVSYDFKAGDCVIFANKEGTREFIGLARKGFPEITDIRNMTVRAGEGVLGKAIASSQAYVKDPTRKSDWLIGLPIISKGRVRALLAVASLKFGEQYSTDEVQALIKISNFIGAYMDFMMDMGRFKPVSFENVPASETLPEQSKKESQVQKRTLKSEKNTDSRESNSGIPAAQNRPLTRTLSRQPGKENDGNELNRIETADNSEEDDGPPLPPMKKS